MALTEEAQQLLAATYADFDRATPARRIGRMVGSGPLGAYDSNRVRCESAYLRLISIVEAYVDSLCSELFRQQTSHQGPMFRALVAAAEARASTNWDERKTAFNDYHSVSLSSCSRWSEVDAGIYVRNAIAHGLGSLTRRQRSQKVRSKIRSVDVAVVDNRLVLTDVALVRCLSFSNDFIRSIDTGVRL